MADRSHDLDGCATAREALTVAQEVYRAHRALERKSDQQFESIDSRIGRGEGDRLRLGDRVSAVEESMIEHEKLSQKAIDKLTDTLDHFGVRLDDFKEAVIGRVTRQAIPSGEAVIASWHHTRWQTRGKIIGVIVAVLITPEFVRPWLIALVGFLKELLVRSVAGH